jgi:two-component system sensor histidine kinase BaeS
LARESVDVGSVVAQVVEGFEPQANEVGIKLTSSVDPDVPSTLADPARLRSVVANLVSNALRHTPMGGSVEVRVTRADDGVGVDVLDTGNGIAPGLLPRVFDRFVRDEGSTGSGLGLAIVKDLVEAHGGTISATSEVGRGTAFRFTLPADD